MGLLEWDERYSVGHKEIDEQHKELVRIINLLHSHLVSNNDNGLEKITSETIKAVIQYGENHFSFEEKLMEDSGYEGLVYHRKLHVNFSNRINDLYERHRRGELVLNSELMKTLQNWLIEHILSEDKMYSSTIVAFSKKPGSQEVFR